MNAPARNRLPDVVERLFPAALIAAVMLTWASGATAQAPAQPTPPSQAAPTNFDFREGEIGAAPPAWLVPPAASGFTAKLVQEGPTPGGRAVVVRYEGKSTPENFGNFRQRIAGARYRKKAVRFRAAVRVDPAPDVEARLFVRVERPGGTQGFFDTGDPITGAGWTTHEITGVIDDDAETLIVGFRVYGAGAAAMADATVEVIGTLEPWPVGERSRALSPRQLDNLTAFARLFGYVRHFHPSDQAARADWNALAVGGIPIAEGARNIEDLAERLEKYFRPLAPTVRVFPANRAAPPTAIEAPASSGPRQQISWTYDGYYSGQRVVADLPAGSAPPAAFVADLGSGLKAVVPIALLKDAEGTLPHVPMPARAWWTFDANDRAVRLADVIIAWNVFQHFYPYFDVVKTDWPRALTAAIASAAADADTTQFRTTLLRLVAALHDGHGRVRGNGPGNAAQIPVAVTWAGAELIVANADGAKGLPVARGDAILAINGRPTAEWLRDMEGLLSSATPQYLGVRSVQMLVGGPAGERVVLDIEPFDARGTRRTVTLERQTPPGPIPAEARPEPVAELKPGVCYVDLTRLKNDEEWRVALPRMQAASAVILDMRGYPSNVGPDFLRNLLDKPFTSAQWHVPIITQPDGKGRTFNNGHWNMTPLAPYVGARKIFLTDARAISYAESIMGIIEHYRVGDIVGGPTAGTNGNVIPTEVPGGYTLSWTGMQVLKHDGSRHHGVGILPTVPVSRTRAGIAAGRDEVLERALALLQTPGTSKK